MRRETKGRIGLGILVAALIGGIAWSREAQRDDILARIEEAKRTPIVVGLREIYWSPSLKQLIPNGLVYKGLLDGKFAVSGSRRSVDFYPLDTGEFEMEGHRYGVLEVTEDSLKLSYLGLVEE